MIYYKLIQFTSFVIEKLLCGYNPQTRGTNMEKKTKQLLALAISLVFMINLLPSVTLSASTTYGYSVNNIKPNRTLTVPLPTTTGSGIIICSDQGMLAMDVAPYMKDLGGDRSVMMVPAYWIAIAFGIPESKTFGHTCVPDLDMTSTVIINGGRVIQFEYGRSEMYINGTAITMRSPDGIPVAAEEHDYRLFVPFTSIAIALGVSCSWDAGNKEAIFNDDTPNKLYGDFNGEISMQVGNPTVNMNGTPISMDVAPYISPASNSLMIPAFFVATALGVPDYHTDNAINPIPINGATAMTLLSGGTIAQFNLGSSQMTINGESIAMRSPNGIDAPVEAVTNTSGTAIRWFVTMNALYNAFGLDTSWDSGTQTVYYEADKSVYKGVTEVTHLIQCDTADSLVIQLPSLPAGASYGNSKFIYNYLGSFITWLEIDRGANTLRVDTDAQPEHNSTVITIPVTGATRFMDYVVIVRIDSVELPSGPNQPLPEPPSEPPTTGGGSSSGSDTSDGPPTNTVPTATNAQSNETSIISQIGGGKDVVINTKAPETVLSSDAVSALISAGQPVTVKSGGLSVTIDPDTLRELRAANPGADITLSMAPLSNDAVAEALKKATAANGGNLDFLGGVLDISISAGGGKVTSFDPPLTISINIAASELVKGQIEKLSGVRFNDDGSINKLGGTYDKKTNLLVFKTSKLSKYGAVIADDLVKLFMYPHSSAYTLNGILKGSDVAPVNVNNRLLVPVRVIAESLGATVGWNDNTKTVMITLDGKTLNFRIGERLPGMDVPAEIINDRTMVPLRFIAEHFGANVIYDATHSTIAIYR